MFFKEGRLDKTRLLTKLAEELGISMALLALAWCVKNPHVSTVILGASKISQLEENFKAVETAALLTEEVMEKIEGILDNKPTRTVF